MNPAEGDRLLSIREVAELTSLPISWLYSHVASGKIPHFKLGKYVKFRRADLEAWLASQRRGPDAQPTPVRSDDPRRIRSVP